ncbi:MAG: hypothetical protein Q9203_000107 [Teloschistes exilis]
MNPFRHPGVRHTPKYDVEKQSHSAEKTVPNVTASPASTNDPSLDSSGQHDIPPDPVLFTGRLAAWNSKVERLAGLEARGITRVLHEEKHGGGLHESGNRTMILGRYVMGYWPSKLVCVLNQIQQIGFCILGCIISGQIISAVNGGGLTIAAGCVISALCIGLIATFGIAMVHTYERYAFIPQLMAFFVLIGSAAKDFDHSAVSQGTAGVIIANPADLYVYYPVDTPKYITFGMTFSATWLGLIFCNILGIGIATGVANVPSWTDAYEVSSGALLLETYRGLGGFGGLCAVIIALGSVTNNAPFAYTAAITFQAPGRYAKAIPRWMWCIFVTITQLNFLPIMSYWVAPWVTILVEEHILFHIVRGKPFDWLAWEHKRRLPIGIAALFAFLCGWAGAIIGMSQVWYQGPVALKVGGYGGDIGAWLAIAFTSVIYPPLRYLELKKLGR